ALLVAPVGCSKQNNNNNSNNNSNNNYQNSQQDDYNNSSNNSNNSSNNNSTTEQESQYSQMLLNVINDENYNALIQMAMKDKSVYNRGEFKPHPYAFLEDEGFDVNAIVNGDLICVSQAFTIENEPNALYITTRAETKSDKPYFTQYILKYNLTKQEMADYKMLHEGFYAQACFLVNEISELHTPEVLSKTNITVHAQTTLLNALKKYQETKDLLGGSSLGALHIIGFDASNNKFQIVVTSPISLAETMITNAKINTINLKARTIAVTETVDGAFHNPCGYDSFSFDEKQNSPKEITIYSPNVNYQENMKSYEINN
ncbi:MAG: hypothetical protein IKY10_04025, partial [Clostridia bacterium]|nr:hypothetical protein [Clostridia bacterium]